MTPEEASTGGRPHILLGVTGSVATIKVAELCQKLSAIGDVRLISTKAARHFITEADLPASVLPVLGDEEEWHSWKRVGDDVMHIDLRRWADVFVVAPLSANSLAKLANGLCDNLLTCVARAWDWNKPFLAAPAMNTAMYEHPFTAKQLRALTDLGVTIVPAVSKRLACGDFGVGAMASPGDIAASTAAALRTSSAAGTVHATSEATLQACMAGSTACQ